MIEARIRTFDLGPGRSVPLTVTEDGAERTVLLWHGRGGPVSVQGIAAHLSGTMRVPPLHPGWNGALPRVGRAFEKAGDRGCSRSLRIVQTEEPRDTIDTAMGDGVSGDDGTAVRKLRIADIARPASVSAATVSRALNGPSQVGEANRKRVLDAISELDYRPNRLAPGRLRPVGLVTFGPGSPDARRGTMPAKATG
jgi:hypothetical protein